MTPFCISLPLHLCLHLVSFPPFAYVSGAYVTTSDLEQSLQLNTRSKTIKMEEENNSCASIEIATALCVSVTHKVS